MPFTQLQCDKHRSTTEAGARRHMHRLLRNGAAKDDTVHTYLCDSCGYWHCGHGGNNSNTAPSRFERRAQRRQKIKISRNLLDSD
jgi:hypothetical protein